jgi:hypothetical protein
MGMGYYGKQAMSNEVYDSFANQAVFEYRRCWWPRRCYATGRWLFGTVAVRGYIEENDLKLAGSYKYPKRLDVLQSNVFLTAVVFQERWYHKDEGLMLMLKKESNGIF